MAITAILINIISEQIMKNSKFLGIRGKIYRVSLFLGKVICDQSKNSWGDLAMDGDSIKIDGKKFTLKLKENKDCSIKSINFLPA
jgi:hypothetical protein